MDEGDVCNDKDVATGGDRTNNGNNELATGGNRRPEVGVWADNSGEVVTLALVFVVNVNCGLLISVFTTEIFSFGFESTFEVREDM